LADRNVAGLPHHAAALDELMTLLTELPAKARHLTGEVHVAKLKIQPDMQNEFNLA
jgi:hypothetical protein